MTDVCGRECPDNRRVYCVHPPGHDGAHAGLDMGLDKVVLHRWPPPAVDWSGDLGPPPPRRVMVAVLVGAFIVTVLLAAVVAVVLSGAL